MLDQRSLRHLANEAAVEGSPNRKRSPETHQRERGLWSFLTWSFFLSQLAAGNAFAEGATKSIGDADPASFGSTSNAASSNTASMPYNGDTRVAASEEPQSGEVRTAAATAQSEALTPNAKIVGVEGGDLALDPALAARGVEANASGGSLPLGSGEVPSDGDGTPPCVTPPSVGGDCGCTTPSTPITPIVDIVNPTIDILPPVLHTVDNLVDSLSPVLNDILVPIVETVEDLVAALNPTVEQLLAPVESIAEAVVGTLAPTVDQILAPVASLTNAVSEIVEPVLDQTLAPVINLAGDVLQAAAPIIEPVGDIADTIVALADPVLDNVVDPLVAPIGNVVDTLQPIVDPIVDVASPLVDMVEPALEPVLEVFTPVLEPVAKLADHLPIDIGNSGLLDGILGGTDAVASRGEMNFPADSAPAGNDLFQAGTYTDYGLALHGDTSDSDTGGLGDLIGDVALPIGVLLGDDDNSGQGLPASLAGLHNDLGLRGLGDGWL